MYIYLFKALFTEEVNFVSQFLHRVGVEFACELVGQKEVTVMKHRNKALGRDAHTHARDTPRTYYKTIQSSYAFAGGGACKPKYLTMVRHGNGITQNDTAQ
jgi:hypothetical protein